MNLDIKVLNKMLAKIPSKLFCWHQQIDFKIYMERQKTKHRKYTTEEEQNWRTYTIWFQGLLYCHNSQDIMILAKG